MIRVSIGTLAAVLATGLLLTGCGSRTPLTQPTARPADPTSSARTTTTPPTTVAATAADGTNLAACATRDCEIQVSGPVSIPVPAAVGADTVSVTSIQRDTVTMSVASTAGKISQDCTGDPTCVPQGNGTFDSSGGGSFVSQATGHIGAKFIVNKLTVAVIAVSQGSAVLRLTSGS
ncbi:hypothetical protein [Amycolatopsis taiwanensis]|uniref:Uncharacterized protein n=1 Tax=Amycolatopsis taiwanensis TaxID=342230 RepID=A0A9W6QWD6_9PSEU|nr:hypothetical protein [Amycolatopsis taiwanensis]GLY63643.1 hypothetical protein Atai01_02620 [Amycolatopsis taiwanensis]